MQAASLSVSVGPIEGQQCLSSPSGKEKPPYIQFLDKHAIHPSLCNRSLSQPRKLDLNPDVDQLRAFSYLLVLKGNCDIILLSAQFLLSRISIRENMSVIGRQQ